MGIIRRSGNISSKTSSTSNFQVEREPVYLFGKYYNLLCLFGKYCNEIYSKYTVKRTKEHRFKNIFKGGRSTIGNTRVSVAYYSFYDNIQLYEPLGKALLFTSIS